MIYKEVNEIILVTSNPNPLRHRLVNSIFCWGKFCRSNYLGLGFGRNRGQ